MIKKIKKITLLSIFLSFCVILLGAYTRLTDAGLGCPDWPGCYGQITAPQSHETIYLANASFPDSPVDTKKARTEMHHRYLAGSLGGFIFLLWIFSFRSRQSIPFPFWLPSLLLGLVIAQALLGMWTVTLRLFPAVVLSHLLGGFSTISLLWLIWLFLNQDKKQKIHFFPKKLATLSMTTLILLSIQILLGGWTSANYASLICPDFPFCNHNGWGVLNLKAFNFLGGLNTMDSLSKITIHMMHRLGAFLTFLMAGFLSFYLWRQSQSGIKYYALGIIFLIFLQIGLGISNIIFFLPVGVAVMHNATAVILLLTLITLNFKLFPRGHHGSNHFN